MSILIELHLYASVCNRGNRMQLNLQILDTKNGYHEKECAHFAECGLPERPSEFCAEIDLGHRDRCTLFCEYREDEVTIF